MALHLGFLKENLKEILMGIHLAILKDLPMVMQKDFLTDFLMEIHLGIHLGLH
jgi:hypothetical protein